jgi:hypothetical protein
MRHGGVLTNEVDEMKVEERFSLKVFWGMYKLNGLTRIWEHNQNINMTEQEQFDENTKNFPDFCRVKYYKPYY